MINRDNGFYHKHPAFAELEIDVSWVFRNSGQFQGVEAAILYHKGMKILALDPCPREETYFKSSERLILTFITTQITYSLHRSSKFWHRYTSCDIFSSSSRKLFCGPQPLSSFQLYLKGLHLTGFRILPLFML